MLKRIGGKEDSSGASYAIKDASFPSPFVSGLEYSAPARGTWNIVHTGMLIPEAHQIFVCAASCLRGVVLTAAEMNAEKRFSTIEIRENNVLDGDMEDLIIDGTADIIAKLPKRPPAILLYTSCIHHFIGCDLQLVFRRLRENFPDIDFTDCYMNPIMRKSGLTPDQLMRRQLYSLLHETEKNPKKVSIIGNDLPTDKDSELVRIIESAGFELTEIMDCKSYAEYQKMAESSLYITNYPAAVAGGEALSKRLDAKHLYLPFSFDYKEIERSLNALSDALGAEHKDYKAKEEECETALKGAYELIDNTPIELDYTFCTRPLGLAKMLLTHGFNVTNIYADGFTDEEKADFEFLKENYPSLQLTATVHAKMRVLSRERDGKILAIGQKAAYFSGSDNFVNVIENGGMFGFEAITKTCNLMKEAFTEEKKARELIQVKGMGCDYCL